MGRQKAAIETDGAIESEELSAAPTAQTVQGADSSVEMALAVDEHGKPKGKAPGFSLKRLIVENYLHAEKPRRTVCVPLHANESDYPIQSFERVIKQYEDRFILESDRNAVLAAYKTAPRNPLAENHSQYAERPPVIDQASLNAAYAG